MGIQLWRFGGGLCRGVLLWAIELINQELGLNGSVLQVMFGNSMLTELREVNSVLQIVAEILGTRKLLFRVCFMVDWV